MIRLAHRTLALAGAFALASFATAAQATPLRFTFSGGSSVPGVSTFVIESTAVTSFYSGAVTQFDIASPTGIFAGNSFVSFFSVGGGFSGAYNFTGDQLYSGAEAAPVFTPGAYSLTETGNGPVSVTISALSRSPGAPAPEIATGWLAALAATAALAFTRLRRQRPAHG